MLLQHAARHWEEIKMLKMMTIKWEGQNVDAKLSLTPEDNNRQKIDQKCLNQTIVELILSPKLESMSFTNFRVANLK